ncbi:MAG: methyltransferase domain-containing protein [Vicinamibacterales bacterium]
MRFARTALASFLVLFLEVALIRWLPAYVRLLAYFSNVILLGAFLGIGLGCLLAASRRRLFAWFPLVQLGLMVGVYLLRLEVGVPTVGSIYFTSGTSERVTLVESSVLLPAIFLAVVAVFTMVAQQMGREMATLRALPAYVANIAGSLGGVVTFALLSWSEWPPATWFGVAALAAVPLLLAPDAAPAPQTAAPPGVSPARRGARRPGVGLATLVAASGLVATVGVAHVLGRGEIWSPYYRITVDHNGPETVISVNNIFHQSAAPVAQKEYFYQWPYMVFGDTFQDVLVLGAGSGTDVAAALQHGVARVDAVEIDPGIIRVGRQYHPDHPYDDPRVTVVNDDARHFLRTTEKKYDLVVFALIDSLTLQSGFSGVRLESYMFTEESFRAVRDRLKPDGLLVVYNYFREPWLVDRLANSAARAFGEEPRVHVHAARSYLGVMLAGPRLHTLDHDPVVPDRVTAFGQSHDPAPAIQYHRDPSVIPATDDWPFLYLRAPGLPAHYAVLMVFVVGISALLVGLVRRGQPGRWSWQFFLLGAGFMLLETRAITQFSLLWGATWVVASLAIVAVLIMALAATLVVSVVEIRRPWLVGGVLLGLLAANAAWPVGSLTFESRLTESAVFALLGFSPIFCAGLLFGSAVKRSPSLPPDFAANLLGAMAGGAAEYLSLVTGFRLLLVIVAAAYVGALVARGREGGGPAVGRA